MNAVRDTASYRKVAVVGAGISGLASAYFLSQRYQVTLFEAGSYAGGHTNTVEVNLEGVCHPVDTGFLVFNDRTYPNLIELFRELGVSAYPSDMSFSVSVEGGRFEWAGTDLDSLFAQRRNLLSPRFLRMVADILRFNRNAHAYLQQGLDQALSLKKLLEAHRYSPAFVDDYLLPMAGCIWSCAPKDILDFPAATFIQFCLNHGLLQISDRPQWKTVRGGGRDYVQRIVQRLDDVRLNTPVKAIRRDDGAVQITTGQGTESFDAVVLATHAPTSLKLLSQPSAQESSVLSAVQYQPNTAILHTDTTLLPLRKKVWSAWNYLATERVAGVRPVCVSYLINQLQPLPFKTPVIVTLNPVMPVRPGSILGQFEYEHPVFDQRAIEAQRALTQLQGQANTWFAGAWTGFGFHEDGLKSALKVVDQFGVAPSWMQL
jgi:predicted NAD/FAD-binding protein